MMRVDDEMGFSQASINIAQFHAIDHAKGMLLKNQLVVSAIST